MKLPEKLGIAGTTISLMGIAFGWIIFPWLLKKQIGKISARVFYLFSLITIAGPKPDEADCTDKYASFWLNVSKCIVQLQREGPHVRNTNPYMGEPDAIIKGLEPGSESREFWEKIPFPVDFRVYIFNVTNPNEVHRGEIPIVQEIGPYQYTEWKEKAEIIDYEEDDSVTFHMKNTWVFNKEKTSPLTGDEIITIAHPLLLGLILAAERDKPGVLGMINKAVGILFNKPETIFVQTTVNDLLWNGIVLNCTTKDFSASAVCAVLKKESSDLENVSPTVSKFSIFKSKNGTNDPNKLQVNRGIVDPRRVGEVLKVNEKKRLTVWRGRPCNNLEGTDSTVFPPIVKPEAEIISFSTDICRSLAAKYVGPSSYKSISALRYNISFGDMSTEPSLKCLCINDTACYKKGVMDLMKCTGTPTIVSLPHFYDAHEDYRKGVKGLNPDQEKHSLILDLEPNTGTPLHAKKRIQFALPIHKVNKIEVTQTLPTTYLPFIWVEESIELPDRFVEKLQNDLFQVIRIVDVLKWVVTVAGAAVMSGGVGLYYKRQNSLPITPTSSAGQKFGSSDFLADKKNQGTELGHTNLGYI